MSNGNGSGQPPWAGPTDRVEQGDGQVSVGKGPADAARERATSAGSQMDRIEAKLDYLIAELESDQ